MLGIAFLLVFIVYLLISGVLAWAITMLVWKYDAKKGWAFRLTVLLLMLAPLFWDWIPMEISHRYKCWRYAGVEIFTTLDEWKEENPGVTETLSPLDLSSIRVGNTTRFQLNQRFAWDISSTRYWFSIYQKDERIVDIKTGKTLAKYTDFGTSIPPLGWVTYDLGDLKFWMKKGSCEKSGQKYNQIYFSEFKHLVKYNEKIKL